MARPKAPLPTKWEQNSLFRSGPNYDLNACVGENGGPYDLIDYGDGFFEGGKSIIEIAKMRRVPVDVIIYPAAFSFRHGIELYVKNILQKLIMINGSNRRYEKNHGIKEYWKEIAAEAEPLLGSEIDPVEFGIAGDIIEEFCQIDPNGQVFRYPEDIQGNRHLIGLKIINLEVLGDGMDALHEILSTISSHLEDLISWEREER